jgi:hypothetical protein
MTPHHLVDHYQHFGGNYCHHLEGRRVSWVWENDMDAWRGRIGAIISTLGLFYYEDRGKRFLQNFTASHPRRQ